MTEEWLNYYRKIAQSSNPTQSRAGGQNNSMINCNLESSEESDEWVLVDKSDERLKQARSATVHPRPPPKPDQCTLAEEVIAHLGEMRVSNFQADLPAIVMKMSIWIAGLCDCIYLQRI